jgi:hypothetical protein
VNWMRSLCVWNARGWPAGCGVGVGFRDLLTSHGRQQFYFVVAATQFEDFNDRFPAIICTIPM